MRIYDGSMTRRTLLFWTAGAALLHRPTCVFATEFWNAKAPPTWTDEEIRQLLTKSPWSKRIDIDEGDLRWTGRGEGIGHKGWPDATSYKIGGTVRWESARPVREASDNPLPSGFAHHYAISLTGFNLGAPITTNYLEQIRAATTLRKKGLRKKGNVARATVVEGAGSAVLLGFPERSLQLSLQDETVEFATTIISLSVRAKFDLKEMLYHGALAI